MTIAEIAEVLESFGLRECAATLRAADARDGDNTMALMVAVSVSVGAMTGYAAALRNHARALRHTSAEHERDNIAYLSGQLKAVVEELAKKAAA